MMQFAKFSFISLSVFLSTLYSAGPDNVKIEAFSHNGSGCPIGTVGSSIAPDGSAISILFDQFKASTENGGNRDYKACSLDIQMKVPQGWSLALYQTQVRGFANILSGSVGLERSRYTFGQRRLSVSSKEVRGPLSEDFFYEEEVSLPSLVYSPCGGGRNLGILTSLEVNGPSSSMTIDSVDGTLSQKYKISWKRCSGTETIGPVLMTPSNFSQVRIINADTGADTAVVQAYAPEARNGVRVAACDLNGDGVADLVTGTGEGLPPHVRTFDGRTGQPLSHPLSSFMAYATSFNGGVYVACGDVNNDGREDLITGAGRGGGPHVKIFNGRTGQEIRGFFAYDPKFTGGVSVASADINGDGYSDIVTGAGPSGGPVVVIFDGRSGATIRSFFAYDQNFRGGIRVAAADINNDGIGDVIVGAGRGGGPHVIVYDGRNNQTLQSFMAYDPKFRGGVSVSSADIDGDGVNDIITSAGRGGGPHIKVISGLTGLALEGWSGSFFGFASNFTYGAEVAASPNSRFHTASNRRFFISPASGTGTPNR